MRATKLTNYENNCTCLSQYNHTIISQKSRESTARRFSKTAKNSSLAYMKYTWLPFDNDKHS